MPIMKPEPGDDLLRLSQKTGVSQQQIQQCQENKDVFVCRTPEVLHQEDEIFIPDPTPKKIRVRTGETTYLVYAPPTRMLRLELKDERGNPRQADYELTDFEYDGTEKQKLPGPLYGFAYQGILEEELPAAVKSVKLVLDDDASKAFTLLLGRLDPVTTTRGLKARLLNLGLYVGKLDDEYDAGVGRAVRLFQLMHGLAATGGADPAMRRKLVSVCGG
jgi:hypothetical protein